MVLETYNFFELKKPYRKFQVHMYNQQMVFCNLSHGISHVIYWHFIKSELLRNGNDCWKKWFLNILKINIRKMTMSEYEFFRQDPKMTVKCIRYSWKKLCTQVNIVYFPALLSKVLQVPRFYEMFKRESLYVNGFHYTRFFFTFPQ